MLTLPGTTVANHPGRCQPEGNQANQSTDQSNHKQLQTTAVKIRFRGIQYFVCRLRLFLSCFPELCGKLLRLVFWIVCKTLEGCKVLTRLNFRFNTGAAKKYARQSVEGKESQCNAENCKEEVTLAGQSEKRENQRRYIGAEAQSHACRLLLFLVVELHACHNTRYREQEE